LRHIARLSGNVRACSTALLGALLPVVAFSAVVSAVFVLSRGLIGRMLSSPGVASGMLWDSGGLFLFAINKVLLGAINGLRWMKTFGLFQALRPVLIVATVIGACVMRAPAERLPVAFTMAEAIMAGLLVITIAARGYLSGPFVGLGAWAMTHVSFGLRSFASGALSELNTRVDVLMLGLFTTDALVGIYSIAATLAEGVYQLLIVLRNNYNPILGRLLASRNREELHRVIRRGKLATYVVMAGVAGIVVGLFPLGCRLLPDAGKLLPSWPLLAILMAGIVIASGYVPFSHILLLAGRPGTYTFMTLMVVAFNAAGNAALIPLLGAKGAAIATAAAFVFHAVAVVSLTRVRLRLRL